MWAGIIAFYLTALGGEMKEDLPLLPVAVHRLLKTSPLGPLSMNEEGVFNPWMRRADSNSTTDTGQPTTAMTPSKMERVASEARRVRSWPDRTGDPGDEGLCICSSNPIRFTFTSVHMGTEWRMVLYAADKDTAEKAKTAAFERVAVLDKTMTDYDPKSELMRLCASNDAAPGKPVAVSDDLFRVLSQAQEVSAESDGAFDITVGPLVKLWRTARKTKQLPNAKELAAAKELVGFKLMTLDAKAKTVSLQKAGMRLDLGGIGKGFAADEAMAVLKKQGILSALIAASGDITVSDAPPGKDSWVVEIAPVGKGEAARFVKLKNASVSTSGDLFQFVEIDRVRYSHVLDPKSGVGLTGRRSVTVIAPQGWRADAMTKAASLLPPDQAVKWIEKQPGAATYIVVKETDDAKPAQTESANFKSFIVD